MTRTRLATYAIAAVAAGLAVGSHEGRSGADTRRPPPPVAGAPLPAPIRPAFTPGRPTGLAGDRFVTRWAPVRRAVVARRRPAARAAPVALVPTMTPDATVNVVLVRDSRAGRGGRLWVRVSMATLPNGRTGWVPRSALGGYGTVDTHLVVDLHRLTATLFKRGRSAFRARVGVGSPGTPTPRGRFFVRDQLTRFTDRFYGPVAFGTNARAPGLTDWPGGGYIGIHGTNRPELIPGRISHGCIRMRNSDILALARRMPVGTPITVR
jgi:lipoprotein-anchoring transpeptidase ErfK/SrfK